MFRIATRSILALLAFALASAALAQNPVATAFDHRRDHRITREAAHSFIEKFRSQAGPETDRATAFNRSAFEQLLAQPGAAGIRIYLAKHPDGSPAMVMVAVDAAGQDIAGAANLFIQNGADCPPFCAPLAAGTFDLARDHRITREAAQSYVGAFQSQAAPEAHRATAFGRSAFEQLLAQPGAAGIRIYRAQHLDGTHTMVMVAVDGNGNDLDGPSALFMQNGVDCPPFCAPN